MSRYIDAENIEPHEIYEDYGFVMVAYMDDIDAMPTEDVVPVVRCKDCKYSEPYDGSTKAALRLKCLYRSGVLENWFCEHGEKVTE